MPWPELSSFIPEHRENSGNSCVFIVRAPNNINLTKTEVKSNSRGENGVYGQGHLEPHRDFCHASHLFAPLLALVKFRSRRIRYAPLGSLHCALDAEGAMKTSAIAVGLAAHRRAPRRGRSRWSLGDLGTPLRPPWGEGESNRVPPK